MEFTLYIFDFNGTLATTKSGATFQKSADDWCWLPGRLDKCRALYAAGKHVALATNQGGVCFEWSAFSEQDLQIELEAAARAIGAEVLVRACYSIPNPKALAKYYNANDPRRKPNAGMLLEAMEHFKITGKDTVMVGDRDEDEQAAQNAGVAFISADMFFSAPVAGYVL